MTKFWEGGGRAYEKALREECRATLRTLRERLANAQSEQERFRVSNEIVEVKADLRKKLDEVKRCLF